MRPSLDHLVPAGFLGPSLRGLFHQGGPLPVLVGEDREFERVGLSGNRATSRHLAGWPTTVANSKTRSSPSSLTVPWRTVFPPWKSNVIHGLFDRIHADEGLDLLLVRAAPADEAPPADDRLVEGPLVTGLDRGSLVLAHPGAADQLRQLRERLRGLRHSGLRIRSAGASSPPRTGRTAPTQRPPAKSRTRACTISRGSPFWPEAPGLDVERDVGRERVWAGGFDREGSGSAGRGATQSVPSRSRRSK